MPVLAGCRWGSWIILPRERLDPAVCVWLKLRWRLGSLLQLWFAQTSGWANEPLKASLICPMALLERQDGENSRGSKGLFVEVTGQLKLKITFCMCKSRRMATLYVQASWNAASAAAPLPVEPLEGKLKMKEWSVPAFGERQLLNLSSGQRPDDVTVDSRPNRKSF